MKKIYSKEEVDKLLTNTIDTRLAEIESKFIKAEKESKFIEKESYEQKVDILNLEIEELKRNQIKIQSGEHQPYDKKHVKNNEPREFVITFPTRFSEKPTVNVWISNLDHEIPGVNDFWETLDDEKKYHEVIRTEIKTIDVTVTGFKCEVSTWDNGNTIYFGRTSLVWIAYGK